MFSFNSNLYFIQMSFTRLLFCCCRRRCSPRFRPIVSSDGITIAGSCRPTLQLVINWLLGCLATSSALRWQPIHVFVATDSHCSHLSIACLKPNAIELLFNGSTQLFSRSKVLLSINLSLCLDTLWVYACLRSTDKTSLLQSCDRRSRPLIGHWIDGHLRHQLKAILGFKSIES